MPFLKHLKSFLCFFLPIAAAAQQAAPAWHPPLDIPLVLSGTFGELRTNHFHSGWDIKTQGVEGKRVYSVADGYVSRIRVGAGGFGRALYITHPNGYTSVYAHLQVYHTEIENYLKERQYATESFEQDFYPPAHRLPVKAGDLIALSGNSGGSAAPHLHFELRNSRNEHTVNPFIAGMTMPDSQRPTVKKLRLYPLSGGSRVNGSANSQQIALAYLGNGTYGPKASEVKVQGKIGVAVEAYDQLDNASNMNGVYSIRLLLDGKEVHRFQADEFAFDETRYINAHIDFQQKYCCRDVYNRLWKLENNKLSMYPVSENGGILEFTDTGQHLITIEVADYAGNVGKLEVPVVTEPEGPASGTDRSSVFRYDQMNYVKAGQVLVILPEGVLYRDAPGVFEEQPSCSSCLSKVYKIGAPNEPLHQAYEIKWTVDIPERLKPKVVMASLSNKNYPSSEGGHWTDGSFIARTRQFGRFALVADTLEPSIVSLNVPQNANLGRAASMKFRISDGLSGISTYRAEVDGKWVLMEFDQKSRLLYHQFDGRIGPGSHQLVLTVTDRVGNTARYETTFTR